jgi:hypothetical protein
MQNNYLQNAAFSGQKKSSLQKAAKRRLGLKLG